MGKFQLTKLLISPSINDVKNLIHLYAQIITVKLVPLALKEIRDTIILKNKILIIKYLFDIKVL